MTNSKSDRSHIIAAGPTIAIAPFILRKPLLALLATLLLLVPFLAPLTAMADVYRWVEDDGTVNYGEREPRDRDYTVISRSASKEDANKGNNGRFASNRAPRPTSQPLLEQSAAANGDNLSDKQRAMLDRLKEDEARRQESLAEIRKSNCDTSKRVLSKMQDTRRIRIRDANGEEVTMSDDERNERISQAQRSIAANCDSLS